jgi:hypothetical protein
MLNDTFFKVRDEMKRSTLRKPPSCSSQSASSSSSSSSSPASASSPFSSSSSSSSSSASASASSPFSASTQRQRIVRNGLPDAGLKISEEYVQAFQVDDRDQHAKDVSFHLHALFTGVVARLKPAVQEFIPTLINTLSSGPMCLLYGRSNAYMTP